MKTHTGATRARRGIVGAACCALLLAFPARLPSQQASRLTIERITRSQPSLAGTLPLNPVWSPDSSRLAFLWNDQGMGQRDVWIVEASGGAPKRVTDFERLLAEMRLGQGGPGARTPRPAAPLGPAPAAQLIWTPDGRALVAAFLGQLVRVPLDGARPQPLTRSPGPKIAPAFSPDQQTLSFLQGNDLWLLNMKTGELKQATNQGVPPIGVVLEAAWPDAGFGLYRWSPDGRYIALLFSDRRKVRKMLFPNYLTEEITVASIRHPAPGDREVGEQAVALYSVESGTLRFLKPEDRGDRHVSDFRWSPDGSQLLIDEDSEDTVDRWMYLAKPEDGSIRELWHDRRETRVTPFWRSGWTSDGQGIIFISEFEGRHHIYVLPVAGGKPKLLTPGDFEVVGEGLTATMEVAPATREVYYVSNQKTPYERQVYRVSETGGPITQVTTLPGIHLPYVAPNGRNVAVLRSDDVTPWELYVVDGHSGKPEQQVTHSPAKEFGQYRWVRPRYVTFPSHVDGVTLHGRLLEPPGLDRSKKYPVLFGPVYRDMARNRWSPLALLEQYLVQEGQYLAFDMDVRGSVGYGREFQEAIFKSVGKVDNDDLESGVRYLKTIPYVDPDRIGIWGQSYGGLMTLNAVFRKPDLFKAAVASCPASNLWHGPGLRYARRPDENPDAYRDASPISFGQDLKARLMIIHGTQDANVMFQDTLKLVERLESFGKNFDFVVVPSAGHCWAPNDYYAPFTTTKLVEHFDRYLGRGPR